MAVLSLRPTAIRSEGLSRQRPMEEIGSACNQAPEFLSIAARSLARSVASTELPNRDSAILEVRSVSQFFSFSTPWSTGGAMSRPCDHSLLQTLKRVQGEVVEMKNVGQELQTPNWQ